MLSVRTLISCIPLRATVPAHITSPDNRRAFLNKTKRQLYPSNRHTFTEDIAIEQVCVYRSYECAGWCLPSLTCAIKPFASSGEHVQEKKNKHVMLMEFQPNSESTFKTSTNFA